LLARSAGHDGNGLSAFRFALYLGPHARFSRTSTMSWHAGNRS
jgi:hypothetical protein